ncbi:transposase [Desulfococcaceae bacterium HSG9]|nr:transposase [Desulfococcaceae bacterium HSG9]
MEELAAFDPDGFYIVVTDNASAHRTLRLDPFWEEHKERLYPLFLLTYSPHLNLIERLWRFMRGPVTKDYYRLTLTRLCEAVVEWFEKISFQEFCSLMGIKENDLQFV